MFVCVCSIFTVFVLSFGPVENNTRLLLLLLFFFFRFGHDCTVILYYIWLLQTHTHTLILLTHIRYSVLWPIAACSTSICIFDFNSIVVVVVIVFFTVFLCLFNGFQRGENLIITEGKKNIVRVIDIFFIVVFLSFFLSLVLSIGSILYACITLIT